MSEMHMSAGQGLSRTGPAAEQSTPTRDEQRRRLADLLGRLLADRWLARRREADSTKG
jgi:hypothetical protein